MGFENSPHPPTLFLLRSILRYKPHQHRTNHNPMIVQCRSLTLPGLCCIPPYTFQQRVSTCKKPILRQIYHISSHQDRTKQSGRGRILARGKYVVSHPSDQAH
ncbi:P21 [Hamiltonella phage APSE-1]|uniref:Putative protein p21 n=1 Tax=Acyrthosiphon pisum secondary endosymbiont phage 1 TaxID=2682836 RepID=VP21_BPAPS|nr:hypothetical protein APSE-1_21 [Hamiltonella phage APSE-1]Q9T1S7.1 RecName: Full=Putative protein p21 [Hamiltonella phage APSE-1]AAF03964.1 P21 [Hamiltonella phage APSE-1]